MPIDIPRPAFLLVLEELKDADALDKAIERKVLSLQKLDNKTYLGFFSEMPEDLYKQWKTDFGIKGTIGWIPLPHAELTGGKKKWKEFLKSF